MSTRRFPAEWEEQQGILLCFPYNGRDWPGKFGAVQWAFVEYIKKVAECETVFLIVHSEEHQKQVADKLDKGDVPLKQIQFVVQKTNRSWMRDSGPIVVKNGTQREALDFNFNGWAKYTNYRLDKNIPTKVADHLHLPLTQVTHKDRPVILEGGALETNGSGILMTTEECLLHPSIQVRNPGFSKADYETVFETYFGTQQTLWLGNGIVGDDTHGHIDDLARFVNKDTVVTVVETKKQDDNYTQLQANLKQLKSVRLLDGKPLNVVELPMPQAVIFEGMRLPASYANFLVINQRVLVPVFNDANDRIALNVLADCFPEREVVPLHAIDLIWGFGTLHCLSQQIPL